MKKLTLLALSALLVSSGMASAGEKKMLSHNDFDSWQRVKNYAITNSGEWAAYAAVPQEGDATLYFYNTKSRKTITLPRGYNPKFTADGRYAVALIKPFFADTRKAKIDKKKDLDLPQDSLALIELKSGNVEKIRDVKSFAIGKKGGTWVAYSSVDTLYAKRKDLKNKEVGRPLVIRDLTSAKSKIVKWVESYKFSKDGSKLALTIKKPETDTLSTNGLGVVSFPDTSFNLISRDLPFYGASAFNEDATQLAYIASSDSTETGTRKCQLFLADLPVAVPSNVIEAKEISMTFAPVRKGPNLALPHSDNPTTQAELEATRRDALRKLEGPEMLLNQYSTPEFSHNGRRLIVGVAPVVAPDDTTIVDFERPTLDIWRWDAPFTPPREKKILSELQEQTFPVVINLADGHQQLIYRNELSDVSAPDRWDADYALLSDPSQSIISQQWDFLSEDDLWSVNVTSGDFRYVGKAPSEEYVLSPGGRYVLWFKDRAYHTFDNLTGEKHDISAGVPYPLWDVDDDHPMDKTSVGIATWSKDDAAVLVYDKYDIWSLDPSGKTAPVCLTKEEGRKNNLRYRYKEFDKEKRYVAAGDVMLLNVFDYTTKENGIATLKYGAPAKPALKTLDKASFTQMLKAKNADTFTYQYASFSIAPDICLSSGYNFAKRERLTDANPQQKDYAWGTAQLFKWYCYDGTPAEGVLYVPDDFDPNKSYPMLSVFYETSDEDLYRHYTMEPSWSWVNYPFYVSRGYVVFVPSIKYNAGLPGESCYNYVCSGVEAVCDAYPNIDRKRLGIDGQSWGGYQTAYLVTRTDMFACAGSGAPVANMTSAYGGIRWGSGDSRQGQYEQGQSRLGRNLWEAPEIYIANSPLFKVDRIKTPLLIMHNDADGAVPWYQGIELFMAMRRLGKPVWMLQYNGEDHNIKERRNRKDITVRLQQFFDHYLKGDPMPQWMENGIPAIRKGQELGY